MKVALGVGILIVWAIGTSGSERIILSKAPLTQEESEVYGAFLDSYLSKESSYRTNLSDRTVPLNLKQGGEECLNGIELKGLAAAKSTIHSFSADILKGRPVRLVDPHKYKIKDPRKRIRNGESVEQSVNEGSKSGVLSLSEIVFDKTHPVAVFRYSFNCGRLCGQGGTIILKKKGDKWDWSEPSCSSWIS